jgi:PTS system mannose-specific IIA component
MITILVITHGTFGQELLRTAQDIVGRQEAVAGLAVTSEMGIESLGGAIDEVVRRFPDAGGHLILVDMLGGTPCNTALLRAKSVPCEVVSGVNLYMVLSAFRHRQDLALEALAAKVAEDGRRAIVLAKALLQKKLA